MSLYRLSELRVTPVGVGEWKLYMRRGDVKAEAVVDGDLGRIGMAVTVLARVMGLGETGGEVEESSGPVKVDVWEVERCVVAPYRWKMEMGAGAWVYEVRMEGTLESVLAGLTGAYAFFGQKAGTVEWDAAVGGWRKVRQQEVG